MTCERRLALAVLALAADDAANLEPTDYALPAAQLLAERRRLTARDFLAGGPMLEFWCSLAGLEASQVAQLARQRWHPDVLRSVTPACVTVTAPAVTPATAAQ